MLFWLLSRPNFHAQTRETSPPHDSIFNSACICQLPGTLASSSSGPSELAFSSPIYTRASHLSPASLSVKRQCSRMTRPFGHLARLVFAISTNRQITAMHWRRWPRSRSRAASSKQLLGNGLAAVAVNFSQGFYWLNYTCLLFSLSKLNLQSGTVAIRVRRDFLLIRSLPKISTHFISETSVGRSTKNIEWIRPRLRITLKYIRARAGDIRYFD